VIDVPFPVNAVCSNTPDTSVGGFCTIQTSGGPLVAPVPDWITGQRVVVELGQIQVFDGGQDGRVATTGNTLFEVHGIFFPWTGSAHSVRPERARSNPAGRARPAGRLL
jgi:hypothetical protein